IGYYQAEIASGKSTLNTRVALAKVAIDVGQLDLAQAELDKVVKENPATSEALFTMGRLFEARNEVGVALQQYRRALSFEVTPELNLAYGRALLKANKEDDAMSAFEQASVLSQARLERGKVFLRRGDLDRALADFQAAGKISPQDPEPFVLAGVCFDRQ